MLAQDQKNACQRQQKKGTERQGRITAAWPAAVRGLVGGLILVLCHGSSLLSWNIRLSIRVYLEVETPLELQEFPLIRKNCIKKRGIVNPCFD